MVKYGGALAVLLVSFLLVACDSSGSDTAPTATSSDATATPVSATATLAATFTPPPATPTTPEPATYGSFDSLLDAMRKALSTKDARLLTSLVATSEYVCEPGPGPISVPSCEGEPVGTSVQAVYWAMYCTACDAVGYSTRDELEEWLDVFFATSGDTVGDEFGPAELVLVEKFVEETGESVYVSSTGIAAQTLFGYPRRLGRWVVTFQVEPVDGDWRIRSLTLADPDGSLRVLPELLDR